MNFLLAAEEGGDQPGLVDPVIGVMLWTLIVFGIVMLVLWKVVFPLITEALDKRTRMIEESIDSAEKTRREADELLREYSERLSDARGQADELGAPARRREANARAPPPPPSSRVGRERDHRRGARQARGDDGAYPPRHRGRDP